MYLTETGATTSWCPHCSREEFMHEPNGGESCCIGDDCMAWRWSDRYYNKINGQTTKAFNNIVKSANFERLGYCGLSGKPE